MTPLEYEGDDSGKEWITSGVTLNELEHTFETLQNGNAELEGVKKQLKRLLKRTIPM